MNIPDNQIESEFEIINISEEFIENDDDLIKFQFSSTNINLSFHQLCKYSQIALQEFQNEEIMNRLKQKLHKYQISENIKEESIILFIQILKEGNVKINNGQFFDLFKLSELFQVNALCNYLKKYAQRHSNSIDFILNFLLEQKENRKNENDS